MHAMIRREQAPSVCYWPCCNINLLWLCLIIIYVLNPGFLYNHLHLQRHISVAHGAAANPTSFGLLDLPVNFNISLAAQLALAMRSPIIQTLGQGFFVPILSSPSFNTTSFAKTQGFSFGFLFSSDQEQLSASAGGRSTYYNIYLAVCAGRSGNYSAPRDLNGSSGIPAMTVVQQLYGEYDVHAGNRNLFGGWALPDGFVVPMLLMNPHSPLQSVFSTLSVVNVVDVEDTNKSSTELQLRDYNGNLVWRVPSVGMMEMQDTGDLLIYDSASRGSNVVWRSSEYSTDTLFQWKMMKPGMELRSPNSAYMARMEAGGLVLYLMNKHFITQQPPYWILPVPLDTHVQTAAFPDLNTLVLSSPCPGQDAGTTAYSRLGNSTWSLYMHPGPCTNLSSCINVDIQSLPQSHLNQFQHETSANMSLPPSDSWSFLRIEDDGRLVIYVVTHYPSPPFHQQYALDVKGATYMEGPPVLSAVYMGSASDQMPVFSWGECDVPMPCGPLGLCTPGSQIICTCPPALDPLNTIDPSKGCKRKPSSMLPPCEKGMEHENTTQYVPLNKTSTVFLFSGWEFASTKESVETCKQLCSSQCSCTGFFYQTDVSACFFMTDEISLLNLVDDKNITSPRYWRFLKQEQMQPYIVASTYATYIKVALGNEVIKPHHGGNVALIASICSILSCIFLLGGVLFCIRRCRRTRHSKQASVKVELELQSVLPLLPRRFTYKELALATRNFRNLLGEGGCGSVYSGILPGGRRIAVKTLDFPMKGAQSKQFLAEIATIGRTNHQNIVHLVGFCWDTKHRLLVYEYVERGSLDRWLFIDSTGDHNIKKAHRSTCDTPTVPPERFHELRTRYDVAVGIARGLSYLHEECPEPILHFDIKPQNILLDNEFVPKLADFGMSRIIQRDMSKIVTGVRGTPGYIAPEWLLQGVVGKKSDVYSMGMVMLEIVGGRQNLDMAMLRREVNNADDIHDIKQQGAEAAYINNRGNEEGEWHFPSWAAKKCEEGLMMDMVDPRLRGTVNNKLSVGDEEQIRRLVHTAFWCIAEEPRMRPSATTVVQWLEGSSAVKTPPLLMSTGFRAGGAAPAAGASTSSSSEIISNSLL